jgi:hypothetical protein
MKLPITITFSPYVTQKNLDDLQKHVPILKHRRVHTFFLLKLDKQWPNVLSYDTI